MTFWWRSNEVMTYDWLFEIDEASARSRYSIHYYSIKCYRKYYYSSVWPIRVLWYNDVTYGYELLCWLFIHSTDSSSIIQWSFYSSIPLELPDETDAIIYSIILATEADTFLMGGYSSIDDDDGRYHSPFHSTGIIDLPVFIVAIDTLPFKYWHYRILLHYKFLTVEGDVAWRVVLLPDTVFYIICDRLNSYAVRLEAIHCVFYSLYKYTMEAVVVTGDDWWNHDHHSILIRFHSRYHSFYSMIHSSWWPFVFHSNDSSFILYAILYSIPFEWFSDDSIPLGNGWFHWNVIVYSWWFDVYSIPFRRHCHNDILSGDWRRPWYSTVVFWPLNVFRCYYILPFYLFHSFWWLFDMIDWYSSLMMHYRLPTFWWRYSIVLSLNSILIHYSLSIHSIPLNLFYKQRYSIHVDDSLMIYSDVLSVVTTTYCLFWLPVFGISWRCSGISVVPDAVEVDTFRWLFLFWCLGRRTLMTVLFSCSAILTDDILIFLVIFRFLDTWYSILFYLFYYYTDFDTFIIIHSALTIRWPFIHYSMTHYYHSMKEACHYRWWFEWLFDTMIHWH